MPGPLLMVNPRRRRRTRTRRVRPLRRRVKRSPVKRKRRVTNKTKRRKPIKRKVTRKKPVRKKTTKRKVAKKRVVKKKTTRKKPVKRKVTRKKTTTRKKNVTKRRKPVARKRRRVKRKVSRKKNISRKRSMAAKKGWRKRRRKRTANPKRKRRTYKPRRRVKRRRRRNTWYKQPIRHKRASKKGWSRRRRKVRGYAKPRYYRKKAYTRWRNPKVLQDFVLPAALISAGVVASGYVLGKLPQVKGKLVVGGIDLGAMALPVALGTGLVMFAPKIKALSKHMKYIHFLGLGMAVAGVSIAVNLGLQKIGLVSPPAAVAGYVYQPMSGYVFANKGMSGYVPSKQLGQIEQVPPKTLGAAVEYYGAAAPSAMVPTQRGLGYQSMAVKPYGLGLPQSNRRYNDFTFTGVYDKGTYE